MTMHDPAAASKSPDEPIRAPEKTVSTDELFQGKTEIYIDHKGERYRLRITRRDKLILQK